MTEDEDFTGLLFSGYNDILKPMQVLFSRQQERRKNKAGECSGEASGGGGEEAGMGNQGSLPTPGAVSATPVTPVSKHFNTQGGNKGGIRCGEKQAKKKGKNKKNK